MYPVYKKCKAHMRHTINNTDVVVEIPPCSKRQVPWPTPCDLAIVMVHRHYRDTAIVVTLLYVDYLKVFFP